MSKQPSTEDHVKRTRGVLAAKPVCDLIMSEAATLNNDPQMLKGFWNRIRHLINDEGTPADAAPPIPTTPVEPMSDAACEEFLKEPFPFNPYKHRSLAGVIQFDAGYIRWLARQNFQSRLARFLKNPRYCNMVYGHLPDDDGDDDGEDASDAV
jgi:hypothetical protein